MSIYWNRSFPMSNSSFLLCHGQSLQSSVLRLGSREAEEQMFLLDAGRGTPQVCMQDELTRVPAVNRVTRFENRVGYHHINVVGCRQPTIRKHILERLLIDTVVGEPLTRARAAARFRVLVGSHENVVSGEVPLLLVPQRFRQKRAWMELQRMWRLNKNVKGFLMNRVRGGYAVAVAGFITFYPVMRRRIANDWFGNRAASTAITAGSEQRRSS